jgi:hypothetical protein
MIGYMSALSSFPNVHAPRMGLQKASFIELGASDVPLFNRVFGFVGLQAYSPKHAFLVFRDKNSFTQDVYEGIPEGGSHAAVIRYVKTRRWGKLVTIHETAVGKRINPWFKTIINPLGSDQASDLQLKEKIRKSIQSYLGNTEYDPNPKQGESGNSNSLIGTVLRAVGLQEVPPPKTVGWDIDIY